MHSRWGRYQSLVLNVNNFFVQDFVKGAAAAALFTLILCGPGYAVASCWNLLGFRAGGIPRRVATAITVSVAITPAAAYIIGRFIGATAALVFVSGVGLVGIGLLLRDLTRRDAVSIITAGLPRGALLFGALWAAVVLLLVSDLQIGGRLFPSIVLYDYAKHISVTAAITRTGVPPANPSFAPGHQLALYYYYGWFLLCSLVQRLGGSWVGPRGAVFGGTVWAGLALASIVALYTRFFGEEQSRDRLSRRIGVGIALLLVTGLDIIPVAVTMLTHRVNVRSVGATVYPSVEWWNEQVTAWTNSVLWTPHHVGALIAGLAAILLLRHGAAAAGTTRANRIVSSLVAAMALASSLEMSVWVGACFGVFWLGWTALSWLRGWRGEAGFAFAIGFASLVVAAPFLLGLRAANHLQGMPIAIAPRAFWPLDAWLNTLGRGNLTIRLADFIALPLNYFLELGIFLVGAALYWRRRIAERRPLARDEWALVMLATTGLLIGTFVRSVIRNNDLGWRSMMLLQFPLLLWSAEVLGSMTWRAAPVTVGRNARFAPVWRWAVVATLVLGATAVAYDTVMMRFFLTRWTQTNYFPAERSAIGEASEAYSLRSLYQALDRKLPQNAVEQPNPDVKIDLLYGAYANRQVAVGDREFGTLYGIPAAIYRQAVASVSPIFDSTATSDFTVVEALCRRYGISVIVVKASDAIWQDTTKWPWNRQPLVSEPQARAYTCNSPAAVVQRH